MQAQCCLPIRQTDDTQIYVHQTDLFPRAIVATDPPVNTRGQHSLGFSHQNCTSNTYTAAMSKAKKRQGCSNEQQTCPATQTPWLVGVCKVMTQRDPEKNAAILSNAQGASSPQAMSSSAAYRSADMAHPSQTIHSLHGARGIERLCKLTCRVSQATAEQLQGRPMY